jgi:hypothetical protein
VTTEVISHSRYQDLSPKNRPYPDTELQFIVVDRKDLGDKEDKEDKEDKGEKILCMNPTWYEEAKSALKDSRQESEHGSTATVYHLSNVAIYTLIALSAQDFAHQALAAPVVDMAQNPQMQEAGDRMMSGTTDAATTEATRIEQSKSVVASPESLNIQEFAPESSRASNSSIPAPELSNAASAAAGNRLKETLNSSASQSTRTGISPPETEVILARTSLQSERSLSTKSLVTGDQQGIGTEQENFSTQPVQDKQQPITLSSLPQQTGDVVAQAASTRATTPVATLQQVETLQDELRDLENVKVEGGVQASPSLSVNIPTAFGADNNTGFISATYQQRTRYANVHDGGLGIGVGLGDAQKAVGVELSYTAASFGGSRDFGAGGFNAKVHRQFTNDWAVAAGWNGFANVGGFNDFEHSLYGVVSKVFRTRDDINLPLSRVAVTAGVGNGQFRTEDAVAKGINNVNVFGNVAVRVAQPVSLIAEWSGQDLGFGVSVVPFKNLPLTITPAVRDVVGAGDGPRFVVGSGLGFKF